MQALNSAPYTLKHPRYNPSTFSSSRVIVPIFKPLCGMSSVRERGFQIPVNRHVKTEQVDVDVGHQIQIINLNFICGFSVSLGKIPSIVK